MKYVLPLMLATAAALGASQGTAWDPGLWPSAGAPVSTKLDVDPPWLTGAWDEAGALTREHDPHAGLYTSEDPHAALHTSEDPHAGLYGAHDLDVALNASRDPHAGAHPPAADVESPPAVSRSRAANGHTIEEIFARRAALREQRVRVRGTVVKRTDGILGKTYLHLRDGSGSVEREDHDLTLTTSEELELGEVVEVEGQLLVDQDLGLGYRYPALLASVTRVGPARGAASHGSAPRVAP